MFQYLDITSTHSFRITFYTTISLSMLIWFFWFSSCIQPNRCQNNLCNENKFLNLYSIINILLFCVNNSKAICFFCVERLKALWQITWKNSSLKWMEFLPLNKFSVFHVYTKVKSLLPFWYKLYKYGLFRRSIACVTVWTASSS